MKDVHECEILRNSNVEITIEKINNQWLWVYYEKNGKATAHGIKYCPYCGEELK